MAKKVFIISLVVLALSSFTAGAQTFYYGVKAGINYSYATQREGSTGKVGGSLGALAGYKFSHTFALQLEADYSLEGYSAALGCPEGTAGDKINIDYLKIPLLAKIYLYNGLNVEAGLSLNLLTSALTNKEPLRGLNSTAVSIPLGVAYEFNKNIELGLRWDISLSSFNPQHKGTLNPLSLAVAWRF